MRHPYKIHCTVSLLLSTYCIVDGYISQHSLHSTYTPILCLIGTIHRISSKKYHSHKILYYTDVRTTYIVQCTCNVRLYNLCTVLKCMCSTNIWHCIAAGYYFMSCPSAKCSTGKMCKIVNGCTRPSTPNSAPIRSRGRWLLFATARTWFEFWVAYYGLIIFQRFYCCLSIFVAYCYQQVVTGAGILHIYPIRTMNRMCRNFMPVYFVCTWIWWSYTTTMNMVSMWCGMCGPAAEWCPV